MIFQINGFGVLGNLNAKLNEMMSAGETPIVTISNKSLDRSQAQNRLMQKWFADIHKSTGQGREYESGRCKYQYFLPILQRSEKEEAIIASFVAKETEKRVGFERFLKVLGNSVIGTTRFLTVKEFAEALTEMQIGEAQHNLTNPDYYGLRF